MREHRLLIQSRFGTAGAAQAYCAHRHGTGAPAEGTIDLLLEMNALLLTRDRFGNGLGAVLRGFLEPNLRSSRQHRAALRRARSILTGAGCPLGARG